MRNYLWLVLGLMTMLMLACDKQNASDLDNGEDQTDGYANDTVGGSDSDASNDAITDDFYENPLSGQDLVCDGIFCSGYGRCIVIDWKPVCDCTVDGYHDEGLECIKNDDTDRCRGVICGNGGTCEARKNADSGLYEPSCSCPEGYTSFGLKCLKYVDLPCTPVDMGEQEICLVRREVIESDLVYFPGFQEMISSGSRQEHFIKSLPTKVSHKSQISNYLKDVPNQNTCGTCTAFATANSMHAMQIKQYASLAYLSQSHLWSVIPYKNLNCVYGAWPSEVAQAAMKNFIVTRGIWPYTCQASSIPGCYGALAPTSNTLSTQKASKINSVSSVYAKDINALRSALASGYNVVIAVLTYGGWSKWGQEAIIDVPSPGATTNSGHSVLLVGYDDTTQQFEFLNSWGKAWGLGGYGKFTYNFIKGYALKAMVPTSIQYKTCTKLEDCSCGICDQGTCKASQEIFNSRDDDCDGQINEGVNCAEGEVRKCGSDIGECTTGTITCKGGKFNNCTGKKDPTVEQCDGKDNNCDGQVDEKVTKECGKNVGICRKGIQTCTNGSWGATCVGEVKASASEICIDGLDNDCDNLVDEGCVCTNGQTQKCGTDVGACVAGTQTCANNKWGSCIGQTTPDASDPCNGIDDDCDNEIDENAACADGNLCTIDTCSGSCMHTPYSCNDHGTCDGDGTCTCASNYTGTFCDQCASGYSAYPSCVQFVGTWAERLLLKNGTTNAVAGDVGIAETFRYRLGKVSVNGGELHIENKICKIDTTHTHGPTIFYQKYCDNYWFWHPYELSQPKPDITVTENGGTITFVENRSWELRGMQKMGNVETDAMPTIAEDTRIIDHDNDTNPGVTLGNNFYNGDMYLVDRVSHELAGIYIPNEGVFNGSNKPDRVEGSVNWTYDQYVIDATTMPLETRNTITPLNDQSTFIYVRVPNDFTCDQVYAQKEALFN